MCVSVFHSLWCGAARLALNAMLSYPTITMFSQNKEQSESHSPGTSNNFVGLSSPCEQ